jgi:hypothetical protein
MKSGSYPRPIPKYYDMVTEQIILTAKYAAPGVRRLFREDGDVTDRESATV